MLDIPKRMRHLPAYKGLPIPYVQFVAADGPDFKAIDHGRVFEVLTDRLCGVCGQSLAESFAVIGGEKSIASRTFTDPPMHKECAQYAARACPYLNGEKRSYSKADFKGEGPVVECELIDKEGVPKRMGILYAKSFTYFTIPDKGPMLYVRVADVLNVDWSIMPESLLSVPSLPRAKR